MDYFSSDYHFGHRGILNISQRPFSSTEEMRETILDNSIRKMKKGDNLFFGGDLSFNAEETELFLKEVNSRKINFFWVKGNHDIKRVKGEYESKYVRIYDTLIIKRYKKIIHINHFPMMTWEKSFYNSFHLYGHVHNFSLEREELEKRMVGKSHNIVVELNDYRPYNLDEIFTIMESKGDNWDYTLFKEKGRIQ